MIEIKGKYNTAKVYTYNVEGKAVEQIQKLCDTEWVKDSNIAIMPDVHAGKGCTIGTTMTITDKVCPNLVGVDIGCGMLTVPLSNSSKIDLAGLDEYIRKNIPSGFAVNDKVQEDCSELIQSLHCYHLLQNVDRLELSLGSLGGGNHFIEIDEERNKKYLIIHTGSRNLGKQVAEIYQKKAQLPDVIDMVALTFEKLAMIDRMKREGRQEDIERAVREFNEKNKEKIKEAKKLSYLSGDDFKSYLHDMDICQKFASRNRIVIATKILNYIYGDKYNDIHYFTYGTIRGFSLKGETYSMLMPAYETIHNYIDMEHMILRKGAVSANKNEWLLIPMNMRDGSLMCRGKGNPDWNYSAPHGAGRLMSRKQAIETITFDSFVDSMEGIYSTSVCGSTIDESPMAYKPMEAILENIEDTVDVCRILKPIYNFKAS